jgi:hypothetical protein
MPRARRGGCGPRARAGTALESLSTMGIELVRPAAAPPPPVEVASGRAVARAAIGLLFGSGVIMAASVGLLAPYLGVLLPVLLVITLVRLPQLRAWKERQRHLEQRRRRHMERVRRVEIAGSDRTRELLLLSAIVDELEDAARAELDRLGLQELMDRYVSLVVAQSRCLAAARKSEVYLRPALGPVERTDDDAPTRRDLRRDLTHRRTKLGQACRRRATQIEQELEAIADFIRLVDAHAACPDLEPGSFEEVELRLFDLDALEHAHQELLGGSERCLSSGSAG